MNREFDPGVSYYPIKKTDRFKKKALDPLTREDRSGEIIVLEKPLTFLGVKGLLYFMTSADYLDDPGKLEEVATPLGPVEIRIIAQNGNLKVVNYPLEPVVRFDLRSPGDFMKLFLYSTRIKLGDSVYHMGLCGEYGMDQDILEHFIQERSYYEALNFDLKDVNGDSIQVALPYKMSSLSRIGLGFFENRII